MPNESDDESPTHDADETEDVDASEDAEDSDDAVSDLETRWAAALLMHLLESGGIEIESEDALIASGILDELADALRRPEDLADRLLDVLLSSDGIVEVFVSEKPLLVALRETRPSKS